MSARTVARLLPALVLAGCVHPPPPRSFPPLLSVDAARCEQSIHFEDATPVILGQVETNQNEILFDENTPCVLRQDGSAAYYRVFRLPANDQPYLLTVRTRPVGPSYLVITAQFAAGDGKIVQTIGADGFTFRGTSLSALSRSRPGQDYLIVQTDGERVGRPFDQIAESRIGTTTTTTTTNGKYTYTNTYNGYIGSSNNYNFVFSHNGSLHVTAMLIPSE